jgi:hypothetical protein
VNLLETVVDAMWEGFEGEVCVDRPLNRICDTGDHDWSMERVAQHVIDQLGLHEDDSEWGATMRSLLGKHVTVTLSREPKSTLVGTLLAFDQGGEVAVRDEEGFIHYGWPNLLTEAT